MDLNAMVSKRGFRLQATRHSRSYKSEKAAAIHQSIDNHEPVPLLFLTAFLLRETKSDALA
jgi:hypothetical protein